MTLNEVKKDLNIEVFNLNTANDSDGKPTDWLRHWDNDNRVAVSIHKDTFKIVKADKEGKMSTLGIQTEEREGAQGPYKAFRIVNFTPPEETL